MKRKEGRINTRYRRNVAGVGLSFSQNTVADEVTLKGNLKMSNCGEETFREEYEKIGEAC